MLVVRTWDKKKNTGMPKLIHSLVRKTKIVIINDVKIQLIFVYTFSSLGPCAFENLTGAAESHCSFNDII